MSTKSIRALIAEVRKSPWGSEVRLAVAALNEVAEIERAAIALTACTHDAMPEAMPRNTPSGQHQRSAMAVLEQIRRERTA